MKQMKLPAEMIIPYDYEAPGVPESVKTLRPVMFKDRERDMGTSCDGFCILLGEDPQVGIMGCGKCLEEAIEDWRKPCSNSCRFFSSGVIPASNGLSIFFNAVKPQAHQL